MQHRTEKRQNTKKPVRRRYKVNWIKASAVVLLAVLCVAAVWFFWLRSTPEQPLIPEASPTKSAAIVPTVTAVASPTPSPSPSSTLTPVPTPTSMPQAVACSPGDSGENVTLLQTMLIDLGFDPGDADGTYGNQLKAAVRNFQLYAALPVDGIAGAQTAAALTVRWQAAQLLQPAAEQPLAGCVIGIDPGHQRDGNPEPEPLAPGSDETKARVSTGTEGQFTGVPEYVVNLQVALKLKAALEALGAQVVMTRETHGVDISNSERAQLMNEAGIDCWLRIHANYNGNPNRHGMFILVPPEGGLNTDDPEAVEISVALAQALLESTAAATGAENDGLSVRGDQAGFNWSKVPVCNIEMGYMSNETEDRLLVTEVYQQKIVDGLTEGFVSFFSNT